MKGWTRSMNPLAQRLRSALAPILGMVLVTLGLLPLASRGRDAHAPPPPTPPTLADPTPAVLETPAPEAPADARNGCSVWVLNGCGVDGAATRWTSRLRARGIPVVHSDNADKRYSENVICIPDREDARALADRIAAVLEGARIEVDRTRIFVISVIVCRDTGVSR